mgnify:CR=1 FL=1
MAIEITSEDIFTPEQLKNHFKIYAGPGAGKTHFLVENVKNIVTQNPVIVESRSRKVLCVTYTNAAVDEIKKLAPSHIILSPGPGYPKDAGICEEVIKELAGQFPILGICLGHQAICEVYGATIAHAIKLMHGKKSDIIVDTSKKIFNGLPKVVDGARYHSLIAKRDTVPDTLEVIAEDRDGEVMGVKHKDFELYGLQFHPESILTSHGMEMIKNFITLCK